VHKNKNVWNHTLSKLEESPMNLKLLYLLFDSSQTVEQIDICKGSSALLKFQSSSCCLVQVCLFFLFLRCNADTGRGKLWTIWNHCIPSWVSHLQTHKQISAEKALPRWSLMSTHVFQTRSDSSPCYNVLLVPLVGEIFKACETTSSLAFPANKSLQRALQRGSSVFNPVAELELSSQLW
jgi:hypothetical protein